MNVKRRSFLRAAGTVFPLPWLPSLAPRAAWAKPLRRAPVRLAFVYVPNGVRQDTWTPRRDGATFDLPPSLAPLAPVRQHLTVLTGLDRAFAPGTEVHAQAASCWLTSSRPTEPLDGPYPTNTTVDQLAAAQLGSATPLPSLELSCNDFKDNRESRYFEALSWYGPGQAADAEKDPRAVFNRLFGGGAFAPGSASVLDALLQESAALHRQASVEDRHKLEEYMSSVRSLEARLQKATRVRRPAGAVPPAHAPEDRGAYLRSMADLLVLAFESDTTRVATWLFDPERWDSPRLYQGVFPNRQNHHPLSHNASAASREDAQDKLGKIDAFHVQQFAYLVSRLASVRDGEGHSLLHNTLVAFGSGLSDGDKHDYKNLSVLLAGRAAGRIRPRGHVRCAPGTPLANLWLTTLAAVGVPRTELADSTGLLSTLLA
ncbi:MAG: DUF1552 domain-containing protein [Myxococcales bacterium]|nr:DUF1552 domain-containing protein [Myxococcales bacterium]